MTTATMINRREMEFSVYGIVDPQYPKPDILYLAERIDEPEAMRFPDLEIAGAEEIILGVRCEAACAQTGGLTDVVVETADGLACICGDAICDFNDLEPRLTGNDRAHPGHRPPRHDRTRPADADAAGAQLVRDVD